MCWFSNQGNKEETYSHNRLDLDVNRVGEANGDGCNPPRAGVNPQNVVQSAFGVLGGVQPHEGPRGRKQSWHHCVGIHEGYRTVCRLP